MEQRDSIFEVKIPTRASRNTKIRVTADNHLLALKLAVRILRPPLPPLEVRPESDRWTLLSQKGETVGHIRKVGDE